MERFSKDQELTVLWKGQKIEHAYLTFVTLWNDGRLPIDANDVPSSSPIVIEPDKPVHVLYARVESAKPNPGLKANPNDAVANGKRVHITWERDEALEQGKGGVVRIIYEAINPVDFHVRGRVKGTLEGFRKSSAKPDLGPVSHALEIAGAGLIIISLALGVSPYFSSREARKTWQRVHQSATFEDYVKSTRSKGYLVPLFIMFAIGIFLCFLGWRYSQSPAWASDIIQSPTAFQSK